MASILNPCKDDCEKDLPAKAFRRVLVRHRERLQNEIQLAKLRSCLLKRAVLSQGELEQLMNCPPAQRNEELVKTLSGKPNAAVTGFVCCLKDTPKHAELAELFEREMQTPESPNSNEEDDGDGGASMQCEYQLTSDRLAVLLSIDDYIVQTNKAPPTLLSHPHYHHPPSRNKLKTCLTSLGFDEVDLSDLTLRESMGSLEVEKNTVFSKLFHECVIRKCKEQTSVFLHVTGNTTGKEESVVMEELMQLVQLLPTTMVTMVIDYHKVSNKEPPWAELTKWNSRTVVFSVCCASSQKSGSLPHGQLTEVFVKALEAWLSRGSPTTFTHRLLYEQMSYWWHGQKDLTHFCPLIQGDTDRTFLGGDGYPYRQWLRADLISIKFPRFPRERFDLTRVQLRTSKMAGLIVDDMLDVFHICRPEEVFKGRVVEAHQLCAIVAMENVEALAQLLEEEYRDIPPGRDSSMDFLCMRKSFPLHVKKDYTVLLDLYEADRAKIKHYMDTSPLLAVVGSSKDAKIVVKKEGQTYTIEDLCGDVTYKPKVKDIAHVPSLLEMMAWFKFVKALHSDPLHHSPAYSCFLTSSALLPLLSADSHIQVSSGNYTAAPIFCSGKEGSYWNPSYTDYNPYMCINLSSNCVVTAADIKVGGNSSRHDSAVHVQLQYCEAIFSKEFVCNNESVLLLELQVKSLVGCVSLERSMPSKEEDLLWYLRFFSTQGMAVPFGSDRITEIAWRDIRSEFFLGQPTQLSKLEIRAPQGNVTGKVKVVVHSSFVPLCTVTVKTPGFPKLCQLDTPVVASMVLLTPHPPVQGDGSPVSLQVQLYGMKDRGMVEVEEGKKVAFRFTNHNPYPVYVAVLCLEETGKIQLLFSTTAAANVTGPHINTSIVTSIPKEHNVAAITDTYKVFVSRKMMYLEPYIQRGLHEHFSPLHYNVCSCGTTDGDKRDMDRHDQWDQYEFKVRIRKSATY